MLTRTIDEYLALPYTIEVIRDESDDYAGWFARVIELPGCMTQADTFEELGEMVEDAMRAWIEIALEDGESIPEPRPTESYSGKFVVRLPRSLHRELAEGAERDGVSLNAFVNVALARTTSQHYSFPDETKSNKTPAPFWPQLSKDAWRAMVAAKLEVEAHTVNEQMFADWLDNNIQQIEAAIEIGAMRDAQQYLSKSRQALKICQDNSPIMKVFHRTIKMLEQQVIETANLRAGIVKHSTISARIRETMQASSLQIYEQSQQHIYDKSLRSEEPIETINESEQIYQLFKGEF